MLVSRRTFIRRGRDAKTQIITALNFTPILRCHYSIGVSDGGRWDEIFNSDAGLYGGAGHGNLGGVEAVPVSRHGRPYSLDVTLPPLGMVLFRHRG